MYFTLWCAKLTCAHLIGPFFGFLIIKTTSNHPGNIEGKKKPCWDNEKGSKCRMGLSVRQEDLGSLEVL